MIENDERTIGIIDVQMMRALNTKREMRMQCTQETRTRTQCEAHEENEG